MHIYEKFFSCLTRKKSCLQFFKHSLYMCVCVCARPSILIYSFRMKKKRSQGVSTGVFKCFRMIFLLYRQYRIFEGLNSECGRNGESYVMQYIYNVINITKCNLQLRNITLLIFFFFIDFRTNGNIEATIDMKNAYILRKCIYMHKFIYWGISVSYIYSMYVHH